MLGISIITFLVSIYIFLSYHYEWERSKKHWQKGIPYSELDKIFEMIFSILLFIFSIYIFMSYMTRN